MKNEKIMQDIVKVYLFNEIDNWEWSYEQLVLEMVGEFNDDGIEHLLENFTEKEKLDLFERYLRLELEKYVALDTVATDKMNDYIIESLSHETYRIDLVGKKKVYYTLNFENGNKWDKCFEWVDFNNLKDLATMQRLVDDSRISDIRIK